MTIKREEDIKRMTRIIQKPQKYLDFVTICLIQFAPIERNLNKQSSIQFTC